jgi:hypothetical protein
LALNTISSRDGEKLVSRNILATTKTCRMWLRCEVDPKFTIDITRSGLGIYYTFYNTRIVDGDME